MYPIAAALTKVCPGPAKPVTDAMHNTTHDNHNTTPPQTVCEEIPAVNILSLDTVRTTCRFPYTDADEKTRVQLIPFPTATCNPDHKQRLKRQEDSLARALEQAEAAQEMSARFSARFARLAGRLERRQRQMAHLSLLEASLALLEEGNDILSQRLTALEELTIQQQGEL
ncbi:hypothetical protein PAXINDRAFT_20887 [Paxillus involutus ATCC 200175]|uniref:Uncharacterized protein n=1 Tax=Paxillus involutus ATCC 200175 TaxID=664439 RepID=A0A0C9SU34_PAXIN|nr:hypothetical protein PAXINDRAFT_20887 [Paxillus involutus ATCC 200175]